MKVETTRFGILDVKEEEVISFPDGLLGFNDFRRFIVLPNPTGGPLSWLQSVEDGSLAFILCRPELFKPDYRVDLRDEDREAIGMEKLEEGVVYTIMIVPKDNPKGMTANMQGPLVINTAKRLGRQVVLNNPDYTTKYKVFQG